MAIAPRLFWIDNPWSLPGRLAISARPSGDWLAEDIASWRDLGVDTVVSLLMPDEEESLRVQGEQQCVEEHEIRFLRFPIPDRSIPGWNADPISLLRHIEAELGEGRNVLIHCRQGVGRSGMIAAAVLMRQQGLSAEDAARRWTEVRGVAVPETEVQWNWLQELDHELRAARTPMGRG
jgi:protein-tyrosine phosphatase